MNHDKTNKMSVRPAKTQINLGICPVWSESSLCAQWVAKDPGFLHADSEDTDQTGLWSDWVDAQADLSLRWMHSHFVGFVLSWLTCCFISYICRTPWTFCVLSTFWQLANVFFGMKQVCVMAVLACLHLKIHWICLEKTKQQNCCFSGSPVMSSFCQKVPCTLLHTLLNQF